MIRKAFVCCAGALAGVSAGAWSDGYFDEVFPVANQSESTQVSVGTPGAEFQPTVAAVQQDGIENSLASVESSTAVEASPSAVSVLNPNADLSSKVKPPAEPSDARQEKTERESREAVPSETSAAEGARRSPAPNESITATKPAKTAAAEQSSRGDVSDGGLKAVDAKSSESKTVDSKPATITQSQKPSSDAIRVRERFRKAVYESPTGQRLLYRILQPKADKAADPLPLLLFLHGLGERGSDNTLQLKHGLEMIASDSGMEQFPAIVIAPQCPADQVWSGTLEERDGQPKLQATPTVAMQLTMELLDSIQLTHNIDPDRIYVTGLSMGGFGTVDLVARRPRIFAAAAALCGGGDSSKPVARRMRDTPFWFIHGDQDEEVNVNRSREVVAALESVGASPRYSELAGYGHNVWDAAYSDSSLFAWMFNQSRSGVIDQQLEQQQIASATPTTTTGPTTTSAATAKAPASEPEAKESTETRDLANSGGTDRLNNGASRNGTSDTVADASRITGTWKVLSATQSGKQVDAETTKKMSVVIGPENIEIRIGDRGESTSYRLLANSDGSRGAIDVVSGREGIGDAKGIFQIKDERLLMCWGIPGEDRPSKLQIGEGLRTLALQREK